MRRVHKRSTGFSSGACDGHSAQPAPTHSTRPMGGGAHAVRGHTSGQRLTGARPCRSTHRNQGNARRAHAAAFEGTLAALAALAALPSRPVVRRRAYCTRLSASLDSHDSGRHRFTDSVQQYSEPASNKAVKTFTAAVWCVPALRVPLVHSLINHFRQNFARDAVRSSNK